MNLGPTEIIVLAVLVIVLFGAKKLPELGSSVGKTITNFRKGMSEADQEAAAKAEAESRALPPPAVAPPVEATHIETSRTETSDS